MITKRTINNEQLLMYSIGQLCAAINRHPNTIRRLERDGVIPPSYLRSDKGYRLYTEHEMRIVKHLFKTLNLSRGVSFPEDTAHQFSELFERLHNAYRQGRKEDYPLESLAPSEIRKVQNAQTED